MTVAYENAVYSELERIGATKNYLRQSYVGAAIMESYMKGIEPGIAARDILINIPDQHNPVPDPFG